MSAPRWSNPPEPWPNMAETWERYASSIDERIQSMRQRFNVDSSRGDVWATFSTPLPSLADMERRPVHGRLVNLSPNARRDRHGRFGRVAS